MQDRHGQADPEPSDRLQRFGGIRRLYGVEDCRRLSGLHIAVVGIGGVGSWAVEALARSGVGHITLIDDDVLEVGNTNRQIHALESRFGQAKVQVMAERVAEINPDCRCDPIRDFLTMRTMEDYLGRGYDGVIDAIDSIKFKAAMITFCRRRKIPLVVTGGAGGRTDPTSVTVADLSRTHNDALLAKVRKRLREEYGFSRNPRRRFDVPCVYSTQQPVYPRPDGSVGPEKPGIHGVSLDCRFGYGSASFVTSVFGMVAVSLALKNALRRLRLRGGGGSRPGADTQS